jgi:response regulator RpfG family c-di-GMP phosphodiesterase
MDHQTRHNRIAEPRRVLIVDDDADILKIAGLALSQHDFSCSKVTSGLQALSALRGPNPFDLMLVDVVMRGMSGFDPTRRALEIDPDLGVITMSGISEMHTPIDAIRAGSIDYLIKPFDVSELVECVTRALKKKQAAFERKQNENQVKRWYAAALALSLSLNVRDKETEGHAERVIQYSQRLGRQMNLSNSDMLALELGARLHDVGKIGVPDHILKKPQKLTDEEWKIMHQHPAIGEQMVTTAQLPSDAAAIVGQHHERWDGSGYPNRLRGDQIHIGARVFAVVDAFDAITSNRCYRVGRDYATALAEIRKYSGTQFDPDVVAAFVRIDEAEWHTIRLRCPSDAFPEAKLVA